MAQFKITGGNPLNGSVSIGGSKNAALPILAAALLAQGPCKLENVPDISDVHVFLDLLRSMGVLARFEEGILHVDSSRLNHDVLKAGAIDPHLVKHMRASILLLGPLLGRMGEVQLAFPGGCVLGKRSVQAHLHAFEALGAKVIESENDLHLKGGNLKAAKFIMAEASVTATENAILLAVCITGTTEIRWAAMEPHVQDLCRFLIAMGADIQGLGTHTLVIRGGLPLKGANYRVESDYLQAGTLVLAGVLTQGDLLIKNCPVDHLDSFWQKLEEVGAVFSLQGDSVHVRPHNGLRAIEKLQTSVYPGFPTDLQAPFTVLLTQCAGLSRVHETLFEGRLNYLPELERMGAKAQLLNPHQAIIEGPTPLRGAPIVSHDIRAGAAMVLAALIAKGETLISDINYIERGYENLQSTLKSLGADIERIDE